MNRQETIEAINELCDFIENEDEPYNDAADMGDDLVMLVTLWRNLTQPEGLEFHSFWWAREHGDCYDCGDPAAYRLVDERYDPDNDAWLRCGLCAASAAADGEEIRYLHDEA